MTPEHKIQTEIRLAAAAQGYTLWRNNVGVGYQGRVTVRGPDHLVMADPRRINFGLCEGSSDLIGYRAVEITPDMVGTTVAVFTAIEVKSARGRATKKQKNFLSVIKTAGGISVLARGPGDLPHVFEY